MSDERGVSTVPAGISPFWLVRVDVRRRRVRVAECAVLGRTVNGSLFNFSWTSPGLLASTMSMEPPSKAADTKNGRPRSAPRATDAIVEAIVLYWREREGLVGVSWDAKRR